MIIRIVNFRFRFKRATAKEAAQYEQENIRLQADLAREQAEQEYERALELEEEKQRLALEADRERYQMEEERKRKEREEKERGAAVFDPDGNRIWRTYTGETTNGKPFGHGILYYDDERRYDGYFVNALFEGQGTLTDPDDNIIYTGEWKKGYYQG